MCTLLIKPSQKSYKIKRKDMEKKTTCMINPILYLFFVYVFASETFSIKTATAQIIPVRVGVVLDMDNYGKITSDYITMALSDFYATHDHYKTRLLLFDRDSKGDVVVAAAAAGLDLLKNVQVQAIIGPMLSVQASFLISLGHKAQVPIITFSATSPSLSSLRSPYFIRATLKDSSQVGAIVAIIQAFGWREVVPIYEDNEFGEGILPFLTDALQKVSVRVPYRSVVPPLATDDQIVAELYKLMTMQTRVFVVHMLSPLASRLFTKAKQLGMSSKEYAWITTDSVINDLNSIDPSVVESMRGVIGVRPDVPNTKELDDFKIRYKKSDRQIGPKSQTPDLDIFRMRAYDTATAVAMAVKKARLENHKYQEANVSRNSTDLEAFGVSVSGPQLIQSLSSITFKGLAGNFRLVDGQLQAPPYQIVNIVGAAASTIGYWTEENGIVEEPNFTSANVNKYSTSKSNLGPVTWPGDKSSPPKGWVIPTNGKKLRVGVPTRGGFTEFVRVTWDSDNSIDVEGYCIDVFDAVMSALPYGVPYEYVPFATPQHEMAGDYNDLTYQVYLGNYDAVAGDVTILGNRSKYVDFTLPYKESGVSMVVPIRDDKGKNVLAFLKPLTWQLWLTSFCSFVFIGFLIWILEHRINEDFRGPRLHQLGMNSGLPSPPWYLLTERVVSKWGRSVLIIWFLVVLILTQTYTASLTSMLTFQKLQPTVTDVNVLIQNKEYVGYMEGSFLFEFLKRMNFDESRLRPFNSAEEMDKLLSKGSINGGIAAAFQEIPYIKLFLGKYCSKYVMVGPTYKADGFGFVFPTGSTLVLDVSRAILNVTEGQKMVEIERKWFGDNTKCPDPNTQLSSKSIGLESFAVLFSVVGIVGVIAFADYMITFQHENRSVIIEPADTRSTRWSKILKWLKIFLSKKTDDGRKSPLNSPSFSTTTDRSQSSVSQSTSAFENETTSQQGESSHVTNMGIEPVDRNDCETIRLT